jgi:hypothetical protein
MIPKTIPAIRTRADALIVDEATFNDFFYDLRRLLVEFDDARVGPDKEAAFRRLARVIRRIDDDREFSRIETFIRTARTLELLPTTLDMACRILAEVKDELVEERQQHAGRIHGAKATHKPSHAEEWSRDAERRMALNERLTLHAACTLIANSWKDEDGKPRSHRTIYDAVREHRKGSTGQL